ncbi:cytochrome P450 4C1-like [Thrips palmi]|uniref:Cytochrome P450 4C1-like n=1 Tax=Thrips palmi TaxID=161013 RepID=A0A6P8ZLM3_THRPL|nr:cytochrome P450 4C1-like [Thrips palmi]
MAETCVLAVVVTVVSAARRVRFLAALRGVPGPRALPLLGNALQLTGTQEDFFKLMGTCARAYGPMFRLWVGTRPFIFLHSAEAVQPILNSGEHIDKSPDYKFVEAWVGQGLVTSTGNKWRNRRKLLTPAFHSGVLGDFLEPLRREAGILADKMLIHLGGAPFDIVPYAKLAALDVICDTALGKHVGAQRNANNAYVVAIDRITSIVQRRFITPWLKPEALFRLTELGRLQAKCVQVIHGFTSRVYEARKQELERQCAKQFAKGTLQQTLPELQGDQPGQPATPGCMPVPVPVAPKPERRSGRRLAMLDLLLDLKTKGADLTDADIKEEVDTFTFAGHDTTAAGFSWCLYVLGQHADVQDRIVREWREALLQAGGELSVRDLVRLDYMECCIKEVLRLYPVVPLIARDIRHPVSILGEDIPAGCTVLVNAFLLHRDPRFFPDPERFDPERFRGDGDGPRHPFAYVPFSAGSRNCIGQRFAMLELKVLLGTVLDRFHVASADPQNALRLVAELVLTNVGGIRISLTPRA